MKSFRSPDRWAVCLLAACLGGLVCYPALGQDADQLARLYTPLLDTEIDSWPVDPAMSRSQEQEIWNRLFQTYTPRRSVVSLQRWIRDVAPLCRIEIDRDGLESIGLTLDTPLEFDVDAPPSPLIVSAMIALEPLDCVIQIQNGVTRLTCGYAADESLSVRVYDVSGIISKTSHSTRRPALYQLMETIQTTVDPESWEELGGTATMRPQSSRRGELLCIAATTQTHWKVLVLIDRFHRINNGVPDRNDVHDRPFANASSQLRTTGVPVNDRASYLGKLPRFRPQ